MLTPEISTFEVTAEIRKALRDKILHALFRSIHQLPPKHTTSKGVPSLTVSQVKERLAIMLPQFRDIVGKALPVDWKDLGFTAIEMGSLLHEWINEASAFLRREGARCVREGLRLATEDEFFQHVWNCLFARKVLSQAQSSTMLRDENGVQICDLVIESLKEWLRHVCRHLWGMHPEQFSPSAFFLDTETILSGELSYDREVIHLRGKPDAIFFDQQHSQIHVWEYKFGQQGQIELQIAQVLIYMDLIEAAKGCECSSGYLITFKVLEDSSVPPQISQFFEKRRPNEPFPARVEKAFQGYIGNDHAVYQLKVLLTLALKGDSARSGINLMLCGPGGTGKTELARRMATALGTPFVNVPATAFKNLDDLVGKIDLVVTESGKLAEEEMGLDSGLPSHKYPPLVVFIDEVHAMAKKADEYLNMLEPADRRAVCRQRVCKFENTTFLAATTDKGKLPAPFLSRFRIIDLRSYTLEEICEIVRLQFEKVGRRAPPEVCSVLAKVGRLTPRTTIERTREFLDFHQFSSKEYPITEAGVHHVMAKVWNVDTNGLNDNDRAYLEAVNKGPKGVHTLASILPCGKEEIERVIEPYLIQLMAIKLTQKGREITEIGRQMLM